MFSSSKTQVDEIKENLSEVMADQLTTEISRSVAIKKAIRIGLYSSELKPENRVNQYDELLNDIWADLTRMKFKYKWSIQINTQFIAKKIIEIIEKHTNAAKADDLLVTIIKLTSKKNIRDRLSKISADIKSDEFEKHCKALIKKIDHSISKATTYKFVTMMNIFGYFYSLYDNRNSNNSASYGIFNLVASLCIQLIIEIYYKKLVAPTPIVGKNIIPAMCDEIKKEVLNSLEDEIEIDSQMMQDHEKIVQIQEQIRAHLFNTVFYQSMLFGHTQWAARKSEKINFTGTKLEVSLQADLALWKKQYHWPHNLDINKLANNIETSLSRFFLGADDDDIIVTFKDYRGLNQAIIDLQLKLNSLKKSEKELLYKSINGVIKKLRAAQIKFYKTSFNVNDSMNFINLFMLMSSIGGYSFSEKKSPLMLIFKFLQFGGFRGLVRADVFKNTIQIVPLNGENLTENCWSEIVKGMSETLAEMVEKNSLIYHKRKSEQDLDYKVSVELAGRKIDENMGTSFDAGDAKADSQSKKIIKRRGTFFSGDSTTEKKIEKPVIMKKLPDISLDGSLYVRFPKAGDFLRFKTSELLQVLGNGRKPLVKKLRDEVLQNRNIYPATWKGTGIKQVGAGEKDFKSPWKVKIAKEEVRPEIYAREGEKLRPKEAEAGMKRVFSFGELRFKTHR